MAKQLTTSSAPFFVQQSPDETRKQMLAQALAGNALSYNPNYASLLGPIAQTMAGAMSGYMMGQAGESYDQRQTAARDDMARALAAYNDPTTYTDPSQGIGPVPYQTAPPEQSGWNAMQGTMMQNPDLAPYGMLAEYNRIGAEQAAGLSPDYMKINDPSSPTGVSWAMKSNPFMPIAPAPATSQGLNVNFNPDGTVSGISLGGSPMSGLGPVSDPTTPTVNRVQETNWNAGERLDRLKGIKDMYKRSYSTVGGRVSKSWDSLVAKFDEKSLSAADKKDLEDYAVWKKRSYQDLTQFLNELSGAAISPEEAKRLLNALPDPGDGWFSGDDPVTYSAAMDDIIAQTQRAIIRRNLWMNMADRGANPWDMPLMGSALETAINDYAKQIEARLKPQYEDEKALRQAVFNQLKKDGIALE